MLQRCRYSRANLSALTPRTSVRLLTPRLSAVSTRRARADLQFQPKIDLETGIYRMARWMRDFLEGRPEPAQS